MNRILFSDLHPATYQISIQKQRLQRRISDRVRRTRFSHEKSSEDLPVKIYAHNSLIRRRLGNTEPELQEGKARSLAIAAPLVDGVVIRPQETFSFWSLVGNPTEKRGFMPGVVIDSGEAKSGIGGGMCQFTNLLHWMALHSPLTILEHHHHSDLDLFPDFKRQIPFGTGTSVVYNFLDYRLFNPTDLTFQFRVRVDGEYLRGELRATDHSWPFKYHIREDEAFFYRPAQGAGVRRHNVVLREKRSKRTGDVVGTERVVENDALVRYDESHIREPILDAEEAARRMRREER